MSHWRRLLLTALVLVLLSVTVLTWGSLGSGVCIFLLVTLVSALLMQKFVTHRDEDWFQDE